MELEEDDEDNALTVKLRTVRGSGAVPTPSRKARGGVKKSSWWLVLGWQTHFGHKSWRAISTET